MTVGLREANQNFAKLVRAVRAGRTVVLTDRGQPLAELRPLRRQSKRQSARAAMEAMIADGFVIPARNPRPHAVTWKPAAARGKTGTQSVLEEREERG